MSSALAYTDSEMELNRRCCFGFDRKRRPGVNDGFYLFLFLLQGGTLYENYCIFLIESGEIK